MLQWPSAFSKRGYTDNMQNCYIILINDLIGLIYATALIKNYKRLMEIDIFWKYLTPRTVLRSSSFSSEKLSINQQQLEAVEKIAQL